MADDDQKETQVEDKLKHAPIQSARNTAEFVAKKTGDVIRKALISLLSSILPYIVIAIVFSVLFGVIIYTLEISTAENITNNIYESMEIVEDSGDIADIVTIKSDSSGYYLQFVDDFEQKLESAIEKLNKQNDIISINDISILKKFIMAEAMTKYPDLGGEVDGETKFQGTIKIKRITPDKEIGEVKEAGKKEVTLTYIDNQTFENYIQNNNEEALNFFTLDENKNILTATWSYSNETGISIQKNPPLDYRSVTSAYTMPFEYPLFFLIDGELEAFSIGLAELAMNSSSEIAIVDNVNTTKVTQTINTYRELKEEKYSIDEDQNENYEETKTRTLEDNNTSTENIFENTSTSILLTNVDSWAIKKDSQISIETSTSENSAENKEGPEIIETHTFTQANEKITYVTIMQTITTTTDTQSSTNEFDITQSEIEENTDDFVKLYNENEDTLNNNLLTSWLFEIMENNEKTANLIELTQYLLYKATEVDYGVINFDNINLTDGDSFNSVGATGSGISIFGISLTKEEFIDLAGKYKTGTPEYQSNMAEYAGDFYDVCKDYNINPAYAYAHSCLETGYGSHFIKTNNYFGMAAYNDNLGAATSYSSPKDSIKAYCEWIMAHATPGNSEYDEAYQRAQELSTENDLLVGTPDNNIYVLFCRYAVLNSTHGSGFGSPDWFTESQGNKCSHTNGSPTTLKEYADYAVYTTNQRIDIAKKIFGDKAFPENETNSGGTIKTTGNYWWPIGGSTKEKVGGVEFSTGTPTTIDVWWNRGYRNFNGGEYHKGMDIGNGGKSTNYIIAIQDGTVVNTSASFNLGNYASGTSGRLSGYGNSVMIKHGNMYVIYGHMKAGTVNLKIGDSVKQGQVLGEMGDSRLCFRSAFMFCYVKIAKY